MTSFLFLLKTVYLYPTSMPPERELILNFDFTELQQFLDFLSANSFAFWTLITTLTAGLILFFLTGREILAWFLRTRLILLEQKKMNDQLNKVTTQLRHLEKSMNRMQQKSDLLKKSLLETIDRGSDPDMSSSNILETHGDAVPEKSDSNSGSKEFDISH